MVEVEEIESHFDFHDFILVYIRGHPGLGVKYNFRHFKTITEVLIILKELY